MKALLKNTMVIMLALGLTGSITACSSGSSEATQQEGSGSIKLTLWDQSVGNTDPSAKLLPQIIEKWNSEHPDIQVERTGTTGEQYKTKIKTSIAAGEAPDVFYGMGAEALCSPILNLGMFLKLPAI